MGHATFKIAHHVVQLPSQKTKHFNRHIIYVCINTQTLMGCVLIENQIIVLKCLSLRMFFHQKEYSSFKWYQQVGDQSPLSPLPSPLNSPRFAIFSHNIRLIQLIADSYLPADSYFNFEKLMIQGGVRKIAPHKIAPQKITPQRLPPWVKVRVSARVRIGGNLLGGNFSSIFRTKIWNNLLILVM